MGVVDTKILLEELVVSHCLPTMAGLKTGLVLGIIGHAVNLWCDRALSVTPNGKITLATMKEIDNPEGMAKLYEGVDPSIPMKSAVFGIMSLVLQFLGYVSIACFVRTFSEVFGIILFMTMEASRSVDSIVCKRRRFCDTWIGSSYEICFGRMDVYK